MATLEVKLKQHTPLIHFQWEQEDATLRASEVKPKLDKFIIRKLGGIDKIRQQHRDWLIGNGSHEALNYKMKIKATSVKNELIEQTYTKENGQRATSRNPLFFANMGPTNQTKMRFVRTEGLKIIFLFFNDDLLSEIKKHLAEFFAYNNFGTRKDKGFGSYYVEPSDNLYQEISKSLPRGTFYIEIPSNEENAIWTTIDYYYRLLKSGHPRKSMYPYQKSFLRYNSKLYWEKEYFKISFFKGENEGHKFVFLRSILGLPGTYTFKKGNLDKDGEQMIEDEYEIEVKHDLIERIPSPITFKVVKEKNSAYIFLLIDEMNEETYDKLKGIPFKFIAKFKFFYRKENGKITHKYISMNDKIEEIEPSIIENSIDNNQVIRLRDFICRCGNREFKLLLPENKISIKELLAEYHKKGLKNILKLKYKKNIQDPFLEIVANIKEL